MDKAPFQVRRGIAQPPSAHDEVILGCRGDCAGRKQALGSEGGRHPRIDCGMCLWPAPMSKATAKQRAPEKALYHDCFILVEARIQG